MAIRDEHIYVQLVQSAKTSK